jgi:mannan endo-1,4-beta-mannosidase
MKKSTQIIAIILLIAFTQSPLMGQTKIDTTKAEIFNYIASMPGKGTVLSGQQCGDGDAIASTYGTMMTALFNLTGKYAAIVGAEYGYKANNNFTTINNKIIVHWNGGGLVTISWHADNPFLDGYDCRWNSVNNKASIDFNSLLKSAPESKARTNYRTELGKVATALKALQTAGVVVIWRPFHEMNGNWFWWGPDNLSKPTNVQAYINLWTDMYNTFVTDYGLRNLIWTWSPINYQAGYTSSVIAYYPGSDYVDFVGEDVYNAVGGLPDYTALKAYGKPIVLSECGPNSAAYGKYDESKMVSNILGKACYFLQWHSWTDAKVGILDNLNASEMMNSASVISRDEVDFSNFSTSINEVKLNSDNSDTYIVHPNPAKEVVYIELSSANLNDFLCVNLYDLNGTSIKKESFQGKKGMLNISGLEKGMYILKMETKYGEMTKKIIKL